MIKPITSFEIDRSKLRTRRYGPGDSEFAGETLLLNSVGFRCCLGFQGAAMGVKDNHLFDNGYPEDCSSGDWNQDDGIDGFSHKMANINDAEDVDDATREAWIIAGFESIGQHCVFTGKYPAL